MKKMKIVLVLIAMSLAFVSCKKEDVKPSAPVYDYAKVSFDSLGLNFEVVVVVEYFKLSTNSNSKDLSPEEVAIDTIFIENGCDYFSAKLDSRFKYSFYKMDGTTQLYDLEQYDLTFYKENGKIKVGVDGNKINKVLCDENCNTSCDVDIVFSAN